AGVRIRRLGAGERVGALHRRRQLRRPDDRVSPAGRDGVKTRGRRARAGRTERAVAAAGGLAMADETKGMPAAPGGSTSPVHTNAAAPAAAQAPGGGAAQA